MVYRVDVKVDKPNGNIKTSSVVRALIEKYDNLYTDKEINNTAMIDLYTVECFPDWHKEYIKKGNARQLNKCTYRIEIFQ